jgi:hypothetical protein
MRKTVILAVMLCAACASAPAPPVAQPATPKEVPASALADVAGDSVETAIAVPADAPNEGIDFENNWIYDRFGRFRRHSWGIGHAGERQIKTITVELPDGSLHKVFFDVTELWKRTMPPK